MSSYGHASLYEHIKEGHLAEVQNILRRFPYMINAPLDSVPSGFGKWTPLHVAIFHGQLEIIDHIFQLGVGANGPDNLIPPLILCSRGTYGPDGKVMLLQIGGSEVRSDARNVLIAQKLLDAGADVNRRTEDGTSALHQAIWFGRDNLALLFIEHGASLDCISTNHGTPIHTAAFVGSISLLQTMVSRDPKKYLHIQDIFGQRPLHYAAIRETPEAVKYLVGLGADVSIRDNRGRTALHEATYPEVIKCLISTGVDINARDNDGDTLLCNSILSGERLQVEEVLKYGPDMTFTYNYCGTLMTVKEIAYHFGFGEIPSWRYQGIYQLLNDYETVPDVKEPEEKTL